MKTLIFIHGADSFLDDTAYLYFLQNDYIPRYTKPWEDLEKPDYRKAIAKKWKEEGGQVWYPAMPNKQNARYRDWKIIFEGILAQLSPDDELTLIGGSLGGCLLLKYFSDCFVTPENESIQASEKPRPGLLHTSQGQKQFRIHQIHLAAACISEGDFSTPTNYACMKTLGKRVHIWHAEDDQIVPISVGRELSEILPNAQTHFFPEEEGYGHFYGLSRFPELEECIFTA